MSLVDQATASFKCDVCGKLIDFYEVYWMENEDHLCKDCYFWKS